VFHRAYEAALPYGTAKWHCQMALFHRVSPCGFALEKSKKEFARVIQAICGLAF
jgi:hypothetical protein